MPANYAQTMYVHRPIHTNREINHKDTQAVTTELKKWLGSESISLVAGQCRGKALPFIPEYRIMRGALDCCVKKECLSQFHSADFI